MSNTSGGVKKRFATVDEYVASQPEAVRPLVERIRRAIRKGLPNADETISYNMPTYKWEGEVLVHFAVWRNHYSLYAATASIVRAFKAELRAYEIEKGTIRFRLADPVPEDLIERIARMRFADRNHH